jgi:EAL domain-containing protein (putative c-di-GMP-specific phosphodiesterase class I)
MPLIGRWVLDDALKKLASNDAYVVRLVTCSINLSGQSLTDLKLYDYILKLLKETAVDPWRRLSLKAKYWPTIFFRT